MIQATKDRKYRPTKTQWFKTVADTEFAPNQSCPYTSVELINFNTSQIHLKGGKRVGFDCLSESQYVHVCNGGYYEDAPEIDDNNRI